MAVAVHRNQVMSEALKNAEVHFETKNINEIREIEAKTKRDIDEKKRQLRRLVGDSYRDLIESADKIVAIAKTCDTILSNVTHVQDAFSQLTHNITSASWAGGDKKESVRRHEELYAVGSRVKYLVDTPEMIWGCLDSQDYLEAARRFLRAHEVYKLLQSNFSSDMLARFPLVSHQWPQVHKFKQQILDAVKTSLTGSSEQTSAEVADALAAAAVLQGLDSAATLDLFLNSRQVMMAGMLAANAGGLSVKAVTDLLVGWANTLQHTIAQVAELFLEPGIANGNGIGSGSTLLLQALTKADETESSGLFYMPPTAVGSTDGPVDAQGAISAEAAAWLACQRGLQERLMPHLSSQVEKACSKWVGQLAQELLVRGGQLLRTCMEASQLCQVERAARDAVAAWSKLGQPDGAKATSKHSAANGVNGRATGGHSWEGVCERVVGRRFDGWQELFFPPILQRAKEIVAASFENVGRSVEGPVETCLAEALAAQPEAAGAVHCSSWPQYSPTVEAALVGAGRLASMTSGQMLLQSLAESDAKANPQTSGFRQQVHQIRQKFDLQLHATLSSCLELLDPPAAPTAPADLTSAYNTAMAGLMLRQASSLAAGSNARDASGYASELEPYIQQQCAAMAMSMADFLQAKFDSLPTAPSSSPSSATVVEQALIIGRLARALSTDSSGLQLILGPPELWRPQPGMSSMPSQQMSQRMGKAPPPGPKYKALLPTFSATAHAAFRLWAQWAASCISQQLQQATQQDEVLRMTVVPGSWTQTVLGGGGGDANGLEDAGEMRFSLPGCPSQQAFAFLNAACQETRRAGGNLLGTEALQVLEWELLGAALQAYQSLLAEDSNLSATVSERGVLQLLFDVRFIRDVLAGGKPLPPTVPAPTTKPSTLPELQAPAVTAAVTERRREGSALEQLLQSRLDPIDWATYEPYLWANVEKYYHRCCVLLGTLVQLQRTHSEAAGKVQPSQELNPLNLLPVVPRFQYLPISAPTHHHLHTTQARPGMASAASKPEPASLDESYSFTHLGKTSRSGAAGTSGGDAAGGSNSGLADAGLTASTLGALQAKLQVGGLGTFSTLLGDKAAEMTAMAQQRFGDIGLADLSSGITSGLLSSFAKGVTRAPLQGK